MLQKYSAALCIILSSEIYIWKCIFLIYCALFRVSPPFHICNCPPRYPDSKIELSNRRMQTNQGSDTEWGQRNKQLQNNRLKSSKWDYTALRKTKLSRVGYGAGPSWAACSQNRDYDPRAGDIVKLCMCFQAYKRLEASYLTPSSNRIRGTLEQAANQAHENTGQALSADAIRLSLIKL